MRSTPSSCTPSTTCSNRSHARDSPQRWNGVREVEDGTEDGPLARASHAAAAYPERFLAKHGARYRVVPADAVILFMSEGGLTRLTTADARSWMQPSLNALEQRLDPARFCRVSRSAIVNLDAGREVKPLPGGYGEAVLSNGVRLEVSRRRLKTLMDRLGMS